MKILTSEAAQQIEDALKLAIRTSYSEHNNIKFEAAIAAIREQKAELEKQEPVAIVKENPFCPEGRSDELNVYLPVGTKLYAAPVEPVKQEPVADYAFATVKEYEELSGFSVNEAFRIGWNMGRTTNSMIGIKSKPIAKKIARGELTDLELYNAYWRGCAKNHLHDHHLPDIDGLRAIQAELKEREE